MNLREARASGYRCPSGAWVPAPRQLKHCYTRTGSQAALVSTGSQAPLGNPALEALASQIQTPSIKTQRLFGLTRYKEKLKYEARAYGCPSRAWVPAPITNTKYQHTTQASH